MIKIATNVELVEICTGGGDGTVAGGADSSDVDFTVGVVIPGDGMREDETATAVEVVTELVELLCAPLDYSVSS